MLLTACGPKKFAVKGVIERLDADGKTAYIEHEAIPGYMPAMTMPFEVRPASQLKDLKPGDVITFTMVVTKESGWIENLIKIGQTNKVDQIIANHPSVRRVREVEPLNVGDKLPDYSFTNELSQVIHLKDFKGQAIGLTFMFTRCLYPNFCPRMSQNFKNVQTILEQEKSMTNWHLFSITFDPEYDTPGRLKSYARQYQNDPGRWNFLSGALIDVDAITEQFGLGFAWRGSTIDHTLRTAVIDTNGIVRQIYIGNEWKPAEFAVEMKKAAGAAFSDQK